jgi:hypothetical protein
MLFEVRGKNRNHECKLRVHADSASEAEAIGWKRGLFVIEVSQMDESKAQAGKLDRVAEMIRRAWHRPSASPMKCFGQAVSNSQAVVLVLCGAATWAVDLHKLVLN